MEQQKKMSFTIRTEPEIPREAVGEQGGLRGSATCPKPDKDISQVSHSGTTTGQNVEEKDPSAPTGSGMTTPFREGWRERKKERRRERRKMLRGTGTGVSPLHRNAPELVKGPSAGDRRGEPEKAPRAHTGAAGGGGRPGGHPSADEGRMRKEKRKREEAGEPTPERRPARRHRKGDLTYAQAAEEKLQVAVVVKGGMGSLMKEQADEIRNRLKDAVREYHKRQLEAGPTTPQRAILRFRDSGWTPPGFLLVTCEDKFTEQWVARWNPGEINGEPLEVVLGGSIPWARKICFMLKDSMKPDPEEVLQIIREQNEVQAEIWRLQGIEEVGEAEGEDRRRWLLTYLVPAVAWEKIREQGMRLFYELIAIKVFRPRVRRGRTYAAGKKEGTEASETDTDSSSDLDQDDSNN